MLSEEQIKNIKEQIISQIKNWDADDNQKQQAISQIEAMDEKQLEEFLIQNKLIKTPDEKGAVSSQTSSKKTEEVNSRIECPFCLITKNKIHYYKLDENKLSIAILEINPLTKAHTLILPKSHVEMEKIPSQAFTLAKNIAKKIKTQFKPMNIKISTGELQGHGYIEIIPIYDDKELKRRKADESELKLLQQLLESKHKTIKEANNSKPASKYRALQAPRRIP